MNFRLSARARRDLDKVLEYSMEKHGRAAAERYRLLLKIAMEDVANQHLLNVSRPIVRKPGMRSHSISRGRLRPPREQRVVRPVHQLVYRLAGDGVAEILAVVGDSYPAARVVPPT